MTRDATLTIDYIGGIGDGVGQAEGRPVYVPRSAVGDELQVILQDHQGVTQGIIHTIVHPGPSRTEAPCPHFQACGGCQLQQLEMVTYQNWKQDSIRRQFEKVGVSPRHWRDPVFIPPYTRRRITFAALKKGQDLVLGLNAYRSNQIVDLQICLLITPALDRIRAQLKPFLHRLIPENKVTDVFLQDIDGAVELILTGDFGDLNFQKMSVIADMGNVLGLARIGWRAEEFSAPEILLSLSPVQKTSGQMTVDIPPASFLQPSRAGEAALIAAVLDACRGLKNKKIVDLFSGCGTFAGHLIQHGSVYAAETDTPAIGALKKVAAVLPHKLSVEKRDLFKEPMTPTELRKIDCVVMDPPRAGAKEQAQLLARSKVPLVVYVSCNPVTFLRDADMMIKGGYELRSVQLVDQFIWSAHSELVGVFTR